MLTNQYRKPAGNLYRFPRYYYYRCSKNINIFLSSQNFISRRFDGATAIFFKSDAF